MENTQNKVSIQALIIPLAIVVAGALIAGGIYMTGTNPSKAVANAAVKLPNPTANIVVEPITAVDHVLGDPKTAKITIIEYSDLECPFCKSYHATIGKIFDEKKADGTLAWVYRHSPIIELHSNSPKEAEATECAAELGGNTVFWKYLSEIFKNTPSNNGLEKAKLYEFADTVGLGAKAFKTCLDSNKYASKISEQIVAAKKAGVEGTPYTVLIMDGKNVPLVDKDGNGLGAMPYPQMKQIIDSLLKQ
ncbi:MAG: DsbA family protein [bacterium]